MKNKFVTLTTSISGDGSGGSKARSGGNDPDTRGKGSGRYKALFGGDAGGGFSNLNNRLLKCLLVALLLVFVSCSFKHKVASSEGSSTRGISDLELKIDPNLDSDGDGVTDLVEIENGTDPLVADVPVLDSNFFQNFTISVGYNKVNDNKPLTFSISTKIKDTDSSFKYKVGKLFGVDNSMYYAAKEGRFAGHSYGIIKNEDFSWVKYPALDPLMLHSDIIKFRPIIDGEELATNSKFENYSVKISLDSTVKLTGVRFKVIKDLSVNFYYHDFEKDSYVLLKNILIN